MTIVAVLVRKESGQKTIFFRSQGSRVGKEGGLPFSLFLLSLPLSPFFISLFLPLSSLFVFSPPFFLPFLSFLFSLFFGGGGGGGCGGCVGGWGWGGGGSEGGWD